MGRATFIQGSVHLLESLFRGVLSFRCWTLGGVATHTIGRNCWTLHPRVMLTQGGSTPNKRDATHPSSVDPLYAPWIV